MTALNDRSAEILESISDAFYAIDESWRFTYVNRRAEQWWGRRREDLLGKVYAEEFPEAVGSEVHAAQARVMEERLHLHFEALSPVIRRWVEADIYPTDGGGISIYFRDITARRQRDAALRESEARLRLAVDAAQMAIWEYDSASERLKLSPELADFLGLSPEELDDLDAVRAHYHPGDRERLREIARAAVARGERHFEGEFRFRRGADDWRWLMLRAEVLLHEDGTPERAIGALLDITERKATEEALRHLTETLEEQVGQRTRELLQAEEALRQSQKMEAIGELTGGVAHDFNNLLTIIRSSIDLLRRPQLTEERKQRYMDAISDTVDRATKLTRQLLAFARRQALQPEIFDAAERIRRISDIVKTVAGARIHLGIEADCDNCFVKADAAQFETAIVNLAVNARDAMDGEGRLRIHVFTAGGLPSIRGHRGTEGEFVAVSVSDTGSGIAEAALPHIFEPFFTTKEVGKGTGLGLSQVYGFAKQSGGDVLVQSRPGEGATFPLYGPRAAPRLEEEVEPAAASGEPAQRRILLVEDNVEVGDFATQLLEELGQTTTLAGNGLEALKLLEERAGDFDLVFTDVVMPGMTGIELAQQIRRRYPGLRVVLTSGYSHVLAQQGSHGFELLQKPYSVDGIKRMLLAPARLGVV
jgi:PAS domain S-box-containing protein